MIPFNTIATLPSTCAVAEQQSSARDHAIIRIEPFFDDGVTLDLPSGLHLAPPELSWRFLAQNE